MTDDERVRQLRKVYMLLTKLADEGEAAGSDEPTQTSATVAKSPPSTSSRSVQEGATS